ncbi:uncharacterized protein LALA0_S03e02058g [Lachancea lanzarotensis]|uniref:LALA0S03e02058g1_1 n=1 Tax=Lachancea lanzarotensis TaxID=1245769 RepID=A0A0C7MNE6_9SACH|nr:uncharacterized protein LALA0_S03e02058g [Lachancea lanzarotensis]CEP61402.1 LALA0S03e02058g1_1 [Lachancea lanzarotensis]
MSSELDQSTWNGEAEKLLKFRDEKVNSVDKDDLDFKRLLIERRIKKAAKEHLRDENAFAKGRIDLVSEGYLTAISMDYDELKTAGVAYKVESEVSDELEQDQDVEGEMDEKRDSPERPDTTMDLLIAQELSNDKASNIVKHLARKEDRLVSSARKNTELVKTMLNEADTAVENTRKRNLGSPDDGMNSDYYKRGNQEHHKHVQDPGWFPHQGSDLGLYTQAAPYATMTNRNDNLLSHQSHQWAFDTTRPPLTFQQESLPKITSTSGIKKTSSGTLSPRNPRASSPPNSDSRTKKPKALRKMENIARKHSL